MPNRRYKYPQFITEYLEPQKPVRRFFGIPLNPNWMQVPIIIGNDSLFKTAEEIRDFYRLPSVPRVEETILANWWPNEFATLEEESLSDDAKPITVCELPQIHANDLQLRTGAQFVNVWFQGQRRIGRWPKSFKSQGSDGGADSDYMYKTQSRWQDEHYVWRDSPVPLRLYLKMED